MDRERKMHFQLYLIENDASLTNTFEFLKEYIRNPEDICTMRREFFRDSDREYHETSTKIALMSSQFYDFLIENGFGYGGDKSNILCIKPFRLKSEDYSRKKSSVMHYYFPLDHKGMNVKIMESIMEKFVVYGMLTEDDYYVHKEGIVEFSRNVKETRRTIMKIVIDNPYVFRVSWARINAWSRINKYFDENT